RTLQGVGDAGRIQVGQIEFRVSGGQAAVLGQFAGVDVNAAAALPVDVFGDVGQEGEIAERPDDRDRKVDVDAVEQARHLGPVDLRASQPEGFHSGAFDEVEHFVTVLLAHGFAQDCAQQPDGRT